MASKNEYYDRIISSLQSDLTSQKTEMSELTSTVARQQQEIEDLKASHITQQKPQVSQQIRINAEALLKEVKPICDEAILANFNHLPTRFADKQDFATFRKSVEQKFISSDTFTAYKRSQETRLKSIEEKLNRRSLFFSTNHRNQPPDQPRKASFNITAIIQFFKNHNPQWLIRIMVFLSICMIAVFIFSTIRS